MRALDFTLKVIDEIHNQRLQPESEMAICLICERKFPVNVSDDSLYVCDDCVENPEPTIESLEEMVRGELKGEKNENKK